ncbi:MAG TPA: M20 family metallopeptidase [Pyrinomonadaceae bacterium]|nr:M20 family metallopeptidase [Pyrinomonadaceae bacterium]
MPSPISKSELQKLHTYLDQRQLEILELIKSVVEAESPSGDADGNREVVDLLVRNAESINCVDSIERVSVPELGEHLVIGAFQKAASEGHVMLIGHTDTVHARGSLSVNPWRSDADRVYGPGIFDMKANCVLALEALRALSLANVIPSAVTLVLTCDEEIGSFSGWPLLERLAHQLEPRCALVLEPSAAGRVKTARKGTAMFTMTIEGKAAHAGLDPGKGASAIVELARQIERLHLLNNSGGITLNVGVVRGGTRSNVVAAEAIAEIDVRFATATESQQIMKILMQPDSFDERVRVKVTGGINRPPLERTPAVAELFERARSIADSLGFELGEAQVGGASDGNFLAAMGIPVLDGLGVDGDGAHAIHEHIIASAIPRRGALLAGLIAQ